MGEFLPIVLDKLPGGDPGDTKGQTTMRLTTKGRFAVTAMIDVAMHGTGGPVTLAAVSERQKISLSYLEQLFGKLRRHGLVESVRGPGGGYNLARAAGERLGGRRDPRRGRADRCHAVRRARELPRATAAA